MRILVFPKDFPSEREPNTGIFVLRRVQALRDLGHEIEVVRVVPQAPPLRKKWNAYRAVPAFERVDGIAVHTIRALVPPRMIGMEYLPLQIQRALTRRIAAFRPDVLHASFLIPCGQAAVRQRVPTVVTAHGGDAYSWPFRRPGLLRAAREAIAGATAVTAVSGYIARCVQTIDARDVTVIWNGGDERFFFPRDRQAARSALGLPADRFLIAFVGNLLRAKGLYDLIDALRMLPEPRPLVFAAGEGADRSQIEAYAKEHRVDLQLLGRVGSERVGELFGAADVVTLPSHNEGLPNVVCEAMLSARAVVATTVGGIPEIVTDGTSGLLVAPHAPRELAAAFARLALDPGLRERLALEARRFASKRLTWRVSARGYDAVYRAVLAGVSTCRQSFKYAHAVAEV